MGFVPVHPGAAHLPIAFVLLSIISDSCARVAKTESRRATCRAIGFWALLAACIGGALAVAAGYWDVHRDTLDPETLWLLHLHVVAGWVLAAGLLLLLCWRWLIWHRGQMTINSLYLVAGFTALGFTLAQGWYGCELVYSFGAGVAPSGQGAETAARAQDRLVAVRGFFQGTYAAGGSGTPGGTNQFHERGEPGTR